jgi:type II secretory pathway component PulM
VAALGVYVNQLRNRQEKLARKLGAYLPGMPVEHRVVLACINATIAVLVKLLVDKGVITNAELAAALDAATPDLVTAEAPTPQPGPPDVPLEP